MNILVFFIDNSIIDYKNVCELEFDEGKLYIKRIVVDSYNCVYIKTDSHLVSNITGIEVLKVYDYRTV